MCSLKITCIIILKLLPFCIKHMLGNTGSTVLSQFFHTTLKLLRYEYWSKVCQLPIYNMKTIAFLTKFMQNWLKACNNKVISITPNFGIVFSIHSTIWILTYNLFKIYFHRNAKLKHCIIIYNHILLTDTKRNMIYVRKCMKDYKNDKVIITVSWWNDTSDDVLRFTDIVLHFKEHSNNIRNQSFISPSSSSSSTPRM